MELAVPVCVAAAGAVGTAALDGVEADVAAGTGAVADGALAAEVMLAELCPKSKCLSASYAPPPSKQRTKSMLPRKVQRGALPFIS